MGPISILNLLATIMCAYVAGTKIPVGGFSEGFFFLVLSVVNGALLLKKVRNDY